MVESLIFAGLVFAIILVSYKLGKFSLISNLEIEKLVKRKVDFHFDKIEYQIIESTIEYLCREGFLYHEKNNKGDIDIIKIADIKNS